MSYSANLGIKNVEFLVFNIHVFEGDKFHAQLSWAEKELL